MTKEQEDLILLGCGWLIGFFLAPLIFEFLWNKVVVYLFHLPSISYWMAFGLIILIGILFRSGKRA